MAQFAVRVYRGGIGYRALVDGWGAVEGSTLAEATEKARDLLLGVLGSAYPDRRGAEPQGACLVVWFDVALRETGRTRAPRQTKSTRPHDAEQSRQQL